MALENPRALSQQTPGADQVPDWLKRQLIPAFLSLRSLLISMADGFNGGVISLGSITIRVVTGVPTQADVDGSIAFRTDGGAGTTMYHREAGVWVGRA